MLLRIKTRSPRDSRASQVTPPYCSRSHDLRVPPAERWAAGAAGARQSGMRSPGRPEAEETPRPDGRRCDSSPVRIVSPRNQLSPKGEPRGSARRPRAHRRKPLQMFWFKSEFWHQNRAYLRVPSLHSCPAGTVRTVPMWSARNPSQSVLLHTPDQVKTTHSLPLQTLTAKDFSKQPERKLSPPHPKGREGKSAPLI